MRRKDPDEMRQAIIDAAGRGWVVQYDPPNISGGGGHYAHLTCTGRAAIREEWIDPAVLAATAPAKYIGERIKALTGGNQ